MSKVTFDGVQKLIIVNNGITELDVKSDLYSAWKEWVIISDNAKYLIAISAIGGDPISASRSLGSTFFLENGWKIRPYEGSHTLTIIGNIFSRSGDSVITPTLGTYNVNVNLSTSNLIDTIATGGSNGPSANAIATEVWNSIAINHLTTGTFGDVLNKTKSTSDLVFGQLYSLHTKLDNATNLIENLIKFSSNKTKIDKVAMTMTIYDTDGVTPFKVFDLRNFNGELSVTEVAERTPI